MLSLLVRAGRDGGRVDDVCGSNVGEESCDRSAIGDVEVAFSDPVSDGSPECARSGVLRRHIRRHDRGCWQALSDAPDEMRADETCSSGHEDGGHDSNSLKPWRA
jgi:hypothetical protein